MAFSKSKQKQLRELLEKLIKSKATADSDPASFKKVKSLFEELSRFLISSEAKKMSLEDILSTLEEDLYNIELYRLVLEANDQEYYSARASQQANSLELIKEKINQMISSGKIDQENFKLLQAKYKEIAKQKKKNEQMFLGLQKGELMARELLSSTLGMRHNFLGPRGILKSVEGFGVGLKEALKTANILVTVMGSMVAQFLKLDKATAQFFTRTSMEGFRPLFTELNAELSIAFGSRGAFVGTETMAALVESTKTFADLSRKDTKRMVRNAGLLSKMQVSPTAYFDISKRLRLNLDMSIGEQESTMAQLITIADAFGRPIEEVFRETAETMPVLLRYGKRFPRVFTGVKLAAIKANMDINDLMTLTERLDKSEDVLKDVAKFNALLGGKFLDPLRVLEADPGEKVKVISEALKAAEESLGAIHPRIVRDLAARFSIGADKLKNIANASFAEFDTELDTFGSPGAFKLSDQISDKIPRAMSIKEKAMNIIQTLSAKVFGFVSTFFSKLAKGVVELYKTITTSVIFAPFRTETESGKKEAEKSLMKFERLTLLEDRKTDLETRKIAISKIFERRGATMERPERITFIKEMNQINKKIANIDKFRTLSTKSVEERKKDTKFKKKLEDAMKSLDERTRTTYTKLVSLQDASLGEEQVTPAMLAAPLIDEVQAAAILAEKADVKVEFMKQIIEETNRESGNLGRDVAIKYLATEFGVPLTAITQAKNPPATVDMETPNDDTVLTKRIKNATEIVNKTVEKRQNIKINVGGKTIGTSVVGE